MTCLLTAELGSGLHAALDPVERQLPGGFFHGLPPGPSRMVSSCAFTWSLQVPLGGLPLSHSASFLHNLGHSHRDLLLISKPLSSAT